MSETVKRVNGFFRTALKEEIDELHDRLSLTERQERIFSLFYIKRHDLNFIADTLNVCPQVIGNELRAIRRKLIRLM